MKYLVHYKKPGYRVLNHRSTSSKFYDTLDEAYAAGRRNVANGNYAAFKVLAIDDTADVSDPGPKIYRVINDSGNSFPTRKGADKPMTLAEARKAVAAKPHLNRVIYVKVEDA